MPAPVPTGTAETVVPACSRRLHNRRRPNRLRVEPDLLPRPAIRDLGGHLRPACSVSGMSRDCGARSTRSRCCGLVGSRGPRLRSSPGRWSLFRWSRRRLRPAGEGRNSLGAPIIEALFATLAMSKRFCARGNLFPPCSRLGGARPRAMIIIRTEGPVKPMLRISRRRFIVAAGAPAVLALAVSGILVAQGAKASNTIVIDVNAAKNLGAVPSIANGLNTATFDGHLNDSASTTAIAAAGVTALRYPGGSTA